MNSPKITKDYTITRIPVDHKDLALFETFILKRTAYIHRNKSEFKFVQLFETQTNNGIKWFLQFNKIEKPNIKEWTELQIKELIKSFILVNKFTIDFNFELEGIQDREYEVDTYKKAFFSFYVRAKNKIAPVFKEKPSWFKQYEESNDQN